ncbi:MAG: hypothetical protein WAT96_07355, partial [Streptococcus suis]
TISSKLTATQVQKIKDRIKQAGIPIDHRDTIEGDYKDFTDYVIYIKKDDLGSSNTVTLTLYTKKPGGEQGWYGSSDSYSLMSFDVKESQDYWLEFDKVTQKWKWKTNMNMPWATGSIGLQGYVFSSTETVKENVDGENVFFQLGSPLELILEVTRARMVQMTLQFWQNLVPYGIILLASWISLIILVKVLSVFRVGWLN